MLIGAAIIGYSDVTSQQLTLDPPKTVDYVDPERYVGRWYEQASIPAFFSKGCADTQALYGLIDD